MSGPPIRSVSCAGLSASAPVLPGKVACWRRGEGCEGGPLPQLDCQPLRVSGAPARCRTKVLNRNVEELKESSPDYVDEADFEQRLDYYKAAYETVGVSGNPRVLVLVAYECR